MYATNETQCVELAYSIVSLLKHNKNVHIFLCTNSDEINPFSEKSIKWLQGVVKYIDSESFLEQIEIKDIYNEELKGNPNENCRITRNALTRLLADKIFLPKGINNILYCDPDVMFTTSIIPLLRKIQNENIALKSFGNDLCDGVTYFNITNLQQFNFFELIRKEIKSDRLFREDQTAIENVIRRNQIPYYDFNNEEVYMNALYKKNFTPIMYHFAGEIPFPVGCVSEEKFVELMPEFAYTKTLLDNYRSSIRFNF
jgi:lipopolysaccharide biosynthesis glycosyltransferase